MNTITRNLFLLLLLSIFNNAYGQAGRKLLQTKLNNEKEKYQWTDSDITGWEITDQYTDAVTGITYIYTQQRNQGIKVYNGITSFALKDNAVVHFSPVIIKDLKNKINAVQPDIKPEDAVKAAAAHLGLRAGRVERNGQESDHTYFFNALTISRQPVKAELVYHTVNNKVLLCWDVSFEMISDPHWWNIRIDALTGQFIDKNDYTRHCSFHDHAAENEAPQAPLAPMAGDAYNVFALPLEAPSFGSRSLLTNPADVIPSPYGWHDSNGAAGAEYTITRGNNVFVYEDANNDNLPGYSPNGGAPLHFDYPFTAGAAPLVNQDASLTNLFYVNNKIHDVLYHAGFTEVAGNFQMNNYGNGGVGNDHVLAEGFDGSGTNNANFNTPPDGYSGRMQMYLFTGNAASCTNLNVTSSTFSGAMTVGLASFTGVGSVTDTLILVNDATAPFTDACNAITNSIAGKVVLIDRGNCDFVAKAQAAQNAGAVGVIIANNVSGAAPGMSGSPNVSIPVVSVSLANGNTLKSALTAGVVTVTINTCSGNSLDGSFDNGIIVHEYGHGVSNRLTGGPSQASCLINAEQGGEGWSDWLALILTIEPGDSGEDSRGIGTYASGQNTNGSGIRRFPYSTDMSINPQTYSDLSLSSAVHNIGEIWCDAIWDMSWLIIDQQGFSPDFNTTSGNYIALRLVLEGMKLQPCNPGFLDARDAILTADALLYNNAHRCLIWEAFARRGMGFNASQGSSNVVGDETEDFSMPPFCAAPTQAPAAAFTSNISTVNCGNNIAFTDQSTAAFDWLWDFGDGTTSILQDPVHTFSAAGTFNVKLVVSNPLGSDSAFMNITVNPAFTASVTASPQTVCSGDTVHLGATASGSNYRSYQVSSIAFAPLSGTGTAVTLSDDAMSTARPIGFTFNFFGTNYTNFYLCSNGFITFSPGMPASYFAMPVPTAGIPDNMIALCWNDLNPQNAGSSVNYFTTGTAPNRMLVVRYSTSHYGGTGYPFVVQAILYETTNIIEIHSTTISNVSAFDPSGVTTQGVENAAGNDGVPVPGRNAAMFSSSNEAWRFTPYIPYTYTWQPGSLSGSVQDVVPQASGTYTVYISDGTACNSPFTSPAITVNACVLTLNLQMMIEGYYAGNSMMNPAISNSTGNPNNQLSDTITVLLHESVAPYNLIRSDQVVLNTNGTVSIVYPPSLQGSDYYISVKQRNTLETWSKVPVTLNAVTNYNFKN
jgi:PKD repeat protein